MKTSAIVCAVLAGSFGFGSVAQAQSWRDRDRDQDRGQRAEQHQRWEDRRDHDGRDRWNGGQERHGYQQPRYGYEQPRYGYEQPRYGYQQPRYVQEQPRHGSYQQPGHRFYRGSYLPPSYRSRAYYVNDWQRHPGLYAPAYGQQWVNVDGEFLLVALATGLIANALMN